MPRYGYVIDESAALALLTLDDSSIGALVAAFEMLAEQPATRPDSYSLDAAGRPLASKAFGRFLVGLLVRPSCAKASHPPC